MREIRRVMESDLESLKIICERAFDRSPGVMKYYEGFPDYVNFCRKQNYAYVAVEDGEVCGVLLHMKSQICVVEKMFILNCLQSYQSTKKEGMEQNC